MITRREAIAGTVAAATVAATGIPAAEASPTPEPVKAPISDDTRALRKDVAELQDYLRRLTVLMDAYDRNEAIGGSPDLTSSFRWAYAFDIGSIARVFDLCARMTARGFRALHYAAIDSEHQYGRLLQASTVLRPDDDDEDIRAMIALRKAGFSWVRAAELIIQEEPIAALIGRTLEMKEMRGAFEGADLPPVIHLPFS